MSRRAVRMVCGVVTGTVMALVLGCGGGGTTTPSTTTTTSTSTSGGSASTTTTTASAAGCELTVVGSSGPVSAILSHTVAMGTTSDGVVVGNIAEVLSHASVPDGVRLPDGSVGVYYVNADTNGIWLARVSGSSLQPVSGITLDGVTLPTTIVDPDAVNVGGKIRLAYLTNFGGAGTVGRNICVAESTDGVTFRSLGVAWSLGTGATQTDPSEIQLSDGSWLMAISDGQRSRVGRSATGLAFSEITSVAGGVPELALTSDGRVRLYVCGSGIESLVSSDRGQTWTSEGTVIRPGTLGRQTICDPSLVAGAGLFLYKTF